MDSKLMIRRAVAVNRVRDAADALLRTATRDRGSDCRDEIAALRAATDEYTAASCAYREAMVSRRPAGHPAGELLPTQTRERDDG